MSVLLHPENTSSRKSHWLLRLFGWLVLAHGGGIVLIIGALVMIGLL